jgi:antirestriction protein
MTLAGTTEITNSEDVIDTCAVIDRIAYLEDSEDADEIAERDALIALASEAEGYADDWPYGEALIRDSYFRDYAMELAEDIGAIDANASWPTRCIDWDQAARELQMDYTAVDFAGVTYWIR